ncbi:MAG: caspase family protein, partial [Nannocystaceae bacterium]|nr:caspase family protein [Nannocystaceae bacterium]
MFARGALLWLFGIAVWTVGAGPARAAPPEPNQIAVERIALIAGSNAAPDGRQTLRYAESDAHRMSTVLLAVGGLELRNQVLVYGATPKRLARGFQRVARRARESAAAGRRVEFVLYFSGHSDEQGLLLG